MGNTNGNGTHTNGNGAAKKELTLAERWTQANSQLVETKALAASFEKEIADIECAMATKMLAIAAENKASDPEGAGAKKLEGSLPDGTKVTAVAKAKGKERPSLRRARQPKERETQPVDFN